MSQRQSRILSLILMASLLAGCAAPEGDGDDAAGDGAMSVFVKDAPTDEFREIHVVFTTALVHRGGDNATDDAEDDGEWITIVNATEGIDVNLLNATNASAAFLGEADLAAGNYTQLRIIVDDAYGIDLDGNRVNFTVPSGTIKIVRGFEVQEDMETRVIVDLDLDRSLVKAGPTGWKLTPVVGFTHTEFVEDDQSGAETAEQGEIQENVAANATA